jgi:hypothetical protein
MADQRVYARTFSQTLTLVAGVLCLEKRVSYRRLRKEFDLDDHRQRPTCRYWIPRFTLANPEPPVDRYSLRTA